MSLRVGRDHGKRKERRKRPVIGRGSRLGRSGCRSQEEKETGHGMRRRRGPNEPVGWGGGRSWRGRVKKEVEVTLPLTANLACNDLRDGHEEEVYGDCDHCEEVVFDIGDSNHIPNRPWARFEDYEEG